MKAPSQAAIPPKPLVNPNYPFQYVDADYCSIKAKKWLIFADRFAGWVSVWYLEKEATVKGLVKILRDQFTTFGVAENLTSDDGSQLRAHDTQDFLNRWGVEHRISANYNSHSNLRVESAVKTTKRILTSNTKSDGILNWDHISRAFSSAGTRQSRGSLSPLQMLFSRGIKDLLPVR